MSKKASRKALDAPLVPDPPTVSQHKTGDPVDCACVIHGSYYSFDYVHKLYNGLCRNLTRSVRLHVYTEAERIVPEPYIHHALKNLEVEGPKKSWWYKTQLFDSNQFSGQLLYFDLDVVIVDNIDFFTELSTDCFWGIRDFRYLFNKTRRNLNSSIMYFDTQKFNYVWQQFMTNPAEHMRRLHGDQDFIDRAIPPNDKKFFDEDLIKSWRWQLLDGGYDVKSRRHYEPGSGTKITTPTRVMVFHGKPKIHEVNDAIIHKYWC